MSFDEVSFDGGRTFASLNLRIFHFVVTRMRLSNRRAHTNSIARIARPSGITTKAGPGKKIIASPIETTVPPSSPMTIRQACRRVRFTNCFIDILIIGSMLPQRNRLPKNPELKNSPSQESTLPRPQKTPRLQNATRTDRTTACPTCM